ncbi:uncharacterized protein LOC144579899 [Callithrix jacchus]
MWDEGQREAPTRNCPGRADGTDQVTRRPRPETPRRPPPPSVRSVPRPRLRRRPHHSSPSVSQVDLGSRVRSRLTPTLPLAPPPAPSPPPPPHARYARRENVTSGAFGSLRAEVRRGVGRRPDAREQREGGGIQAEVGALGSPVEAGVS